MQTTIRRKSLNRDINVVPIYRELISPDAFVRLSEKDRRKIVKITIEPAKLGSKLFGGLLVEYANPIFKSK